MRDSVYAQQHGSHEMPYSKENYFVEKILNFAPVTKAELLDAREQKASTKDWFAENTHIENSDSKNVINGSSES